MSTQQQNSVGRQHRLGQRLHARSAALVETGGCADPGRRTFFEDRPAPQETPPETRRQRVTPREVLIVDDNEDVRDLLQLWIEDNGFQVATASNGAEALAWIKRGGRPALILLDLQMPVMNGWEMLEKLKADKALASVPVAVMSAHHRGPVPADYFLPKPLDLEVLLEVLRARCGG